MMSTTYFSFINLSSSKIFTMEEKEGRIDCLKKPNTNLKQVFYKEMIMYQTNN